MFALESSVPDFFEAGSGEGMEISHLKGSCLVSVQVVGLASVSVPSSLLPYVTILAPLGQAM